MVTKRDRNFLIEIFNQYISEGTELEWLNSLLYSGEDDEVIDELKNILSSIAPSMEWGNSIGFDSIPKEDITSIVVECLGAKTLQSKKIRKFLLDSLIENSSDEEIVDLMRNISASDISDLQHKIVEKPFSPSSKVMFNFCKSSKIPHSFATKNPSSKQAPLIITRTIAPLHPLMPFQSMVKDKIIEQLKSDNGRALVVMPTGSGKTRTATQSIIEALSEELIPRNGIVWIADRAELCEQAVGTIKEVSERLCNFENYLWRYWDGNDVEMYEIDGVNTVPGIVVCGKDQLQSRMEKSDPAAESIIFNSNVIIVDEAHRNLDWLNQIDTTLKSKSQTTTLIGLSATPFRRLANESAILQGIFPYNPITPVEGGSSDPESVTEDLVRERILARRIDKKPEDYGISSLGTGDSQLRSVTIKIIEALIEDGHESILVFTPNVKWGKLCSMILSIKAPHLQSECLHGGTPSKSRKDIISSFRAGKTKVLFNCELLTTGFDAPIIDAVVIARNTNPNDPLFYQMVGRGLRGPRWDPDNVKDTCTVVHQRW